MQGPVRVAGGPVVGGRLGRSRRWSLIRHGPGGDGGRLHRKEQQPEEHGCHEGGPDPGGFQPGESTKTVSHIERAAA